MKKLTSQKIIEKVLTLRKDFAPFRILERERHENTAIDIIEQNPILTENQLKTALKFANLAWKDGAPQNIRFGKPFLGIAVSEVFANNSIEKINNLINHSYWGEDIDKAKEIMKTIEGIGPLFVSLLFYLKNRELYNVFTPTTKRGLKQIYPHLEFTELFQGDYQTFNSTVNKLKARYKLPAQMVDWILWNLTETL